MNAARAGFGVLLVITLACIVLVVWKALRNPMADRNHAFDLRLGSIHPPISDLPEPDKAPLKDQRELITKKTALWKPLVAPPKAAEATPDLAAQLKDLTPTRQQIVKGGAVSVKVRTSPDDKQGRWVAVGDTLNGATIKEIKPDAVVFSVQQNGKEYTAELRRK